MASFYWYRSRLLIRPRIASGDFGHAYRRALGLPAAPPLSTAYTVTPGGGMAQGGAVASHVGFSPRPAGGQPLGGSTAPLTGFGPHPAGGMALGGAVDVNGSHAYEFDPSGGMALGGAAYVAGGAVVLVCAGGCTWDMPQEPWASVYFRSVAGSVWGGYSQHAVLPYVVYNGADVPAALAAWWTSQTALQAVLSDGLLWHFEAPEDVALPYLTYFTVAETERDGRTTGYAYMDTVIQFSVHADTDQAAATIRKALRRAILNARLAVDGVPVWYCLPGAQTLSIGEGFAPGGKDCWIATVDVLIPWQTDAV